MMTHKLMSMIILSLSFAACTEDPPAEKVGDADGDGYAADVDCRDFDRFTYPGAIEPCDNIDNDCDGLIDEDFDHDQDGFSSCSGDCSDNNPEINPQASDVVNGLDDDCDGIVDNNNDQFDDDGDGYTEQQGDCNDNINNGGAYIGPRSIEIQVDELGAPELVDNDCDGQIDEASNLTCCFQAGVQVPDEFELGQFGVYLDEFGWGNGDMRSHDVVSSFGDSITPTDGNRMIVLSTGLATSGANVEREPGTDFGDAYDHHFPLLRSGCSLDDPDEVNDISEFVIETDAPTNAFGVAFDFYYMTSHFAEYVCTPNEDTFSTIVESGSIANNVIVDSQGNYGNHNYEHITVCDSSLSPSCMGDSELAGTGYEGGVGGGTGWLHTTFPISPGAKTTIRFQVYEEIDGNNDSTVLIDNFRWILQDNVTTSTTVIP